MTPRPLLAALALFAVAGCAPPPGQGPSMGAAASDGAVISARLGETARVGALRITPMLVQEDSRCPADATCIQGGTLRLEARLESETVAAVRVLEIAAPVSFAGREIELVAGCPYPLASQPTPPAERRYVFAVGAQPRERSANPPDYCA